MIRLVATLLLLLAACGGTVSEPIDSGPKTSVPESSPDASESSAPDAETCGWKCEPYQGNTAYIDTCTMRACPGTGGCASKFVPNPCADGGK